MSYAKLLLPLVLIVAGAGQARALVGVEVKLWRPDVDTEAKSTTDALKGTTIDLDDDLDLDSTDDVPFIKVWLGGKHRITGSMMRVKLSGDAFPDVKFNFGGETFVLGTEVKTELETTIYRIAWETDWLPGPGLRLGTIFGTEILDVEASVKNDLVGEEKVDLKAPIPIIGLQGEFGLPWNFGIYGEVAGVGIDYGDFSGSFIEYEVGLKYKLLAGRVYAMAGWRQLHIKVEEDDEEGEVDLKGFTFGAGVRF